MHTTDSGRATAAARLTRGVLALALVLAALPAMAGPGHAATRPAGYRLPRSAKGLALNRLSGVRAFGHTGHRTRAVRAAGAVTPSPSSYGCRETLGTNQIKVNQNCANQPEGDFWGRSTANNETAVAVNPANFNLVLAAANDYRLGDGHCVAYYSRDGGLTWGDSTVPIDTVPGSAFGALLHYWTSSGDPSVGFDSQGNAYLACLAFNRGFSQGVADKEDEFSGIYVFRSADGGASWLYPPSPVVETPDVNILEDKPYMAIDSFASSPHQDTIYVTWTRFDFTDPGGVFSFKIFFSRSTDRGLTFSAPAAISGTSAELCPVFSDPGQPDACEFNHFSLPVVGPDGAVYVFFQNFDNPECFIPGFDPNGENFCQILMVKSTDGGLSWSVPVKVSNFYDLPDCATYTGQNAGRSCVVAMSATGPNANSIFRATNYPTAAVDFGNPAHLVVHVGSYLNAKSNETTGCAPAGLSSDFLPLYIGVGQPPSGGGAGAACSNGIVQIESTDGGATWNGGVAGCLSAAPPHSQCDPRALPLVSDPTKKMDAFWQWTNPVAMASRLDVAYYDRSVSTNQSTGFSDVFLASSTNLGGSYTRTRVTTTSMPPPSQFEGLFLGDYMGLAVAQPINQAGRTVYPTWTDTRDTQFAQSGNGLSLVVAGNEQNVFSARIRRG